VAQENRTDRTNTSKPRTLGWVLAGFGLATLALIVSFTAGI
jgi:hypothetical protein